MNSIRISAGLGFYGDHWEPVVASIERGDVQFIASDHLAEMQCIFQACLQDAGATPARDEELAAMLMLFNEGIRVSSRRRLPDAQHLQPLATTFRLIRSAIA